MLPCISQDPEYSAEFWKYSLKDSLSLVDNYLNGDLYHKYLSAGLLREMESYAYFIIQI